MPNISINRINVLRIVPRYYEGAWTNYSQPKEERSKVFSMLRSGIPMTQIAQKMSLKYNRIRLIKKDWMEFARKELQLGF